MNIFDMAGQNAENLRRNYSMLEDRCENQNDLDIVREFANLVEDVWTISINMRPFAFNNFLITGAYKNIYELKKEIRKHLKAVKPEISVEEAIKKHLKKYYKSRVTFDQTFEDGEKFKYGALNIGGHGLQKFGEYCVVINRDQSKRYVSLTFIKEESLHYIDGDHVDVQRLSQDVANRECVHFLAVSKHENDIKRIPADDWTFLVCCDNCYIEVVTTDNISNKHIESVRVNKKYYDFIKNLYYKDLISEISDSERFLLYDFKNMQELLKKQGITLEVIGKWK